MGISFQNALDFDPVIQINGCEFLACLAMVSHLTRASIETQTVNEIWNILIAEDLADPDEGLNTSLSYYRTFDLAFDYLNQEGYYGDQVGCIMFGKIDYWPWVTHRHFQYAIRRMRTANGTPHSVLLNQDLVEIYNPAPEYPGGETTGIFLFHVANHKPSEGDPQ